MNALAFYFTVISFMDLWSSQTNIKKIEKSKAKKISRKIRGFLIKKKQHYFFCI